MLCPEVFRFDPPQHSIVQKTGNIGTGKNVINPLAAGIRSHSFNRMLSIVLPGCVSISADCVKETLSDSESYVVKGLSLAVLVRRNFIEAFIKQGTFSALSYGTQLDTDDCVAVTSKGVLVLHLLRETYQTIGLTGKQSMYDRKRHMKYVVEVDLRTLMPETGDYERIKRALSEDVLGTFDLLLTWTPHSVDGEPKICPSSVGKYFHDADYTVEAMPMQLQAHVEYNQKVPLFALADPEQLQCCTTEDLIEYIGMMALSCNTEEEEEYLSSYNCCGITQDVAKVTVVNCKGFFSVRQMERLLQKLQTEMMHEETPVPWIALHVQGFAHCPINYGMEENSYHSNGGSSYTIVLNPKGEYLWHRFVSNSNPPR